MHYRAAITFIFTKFKVIQIALRTKFAVQKIYCVPTSVTIALCVIKIMVFNIIVCS